jgi:cyclic beta-1,2-glucan synthetase
VARPERPRHAHPLLRRPALAALRGWRTTPRPRATPPVFDETVPFIEAPPLQPGEQEAYGPARVSRETATLYEHCLRAIDKGTTAGAHGLPLFGSGDWNDGMNRGGRQGRGESVWLGWFLHSVLTAFAPVCEARGTRPAARGTGPRPDAWPGPGPCLGRRLVPRGTYDDGTPLGSAQNDECRIDRSRQSWAVSRAGAPGAGERAMDALRPTGAARQARSAPLHAALRRLGQEPGLHQGIPAGDPRERRPVHARRDWAVMAVAGLGSGDEAAELFHLLNPVNHARTPPRPSANKVEPLRRGGDVYAHPPTGRGGVDLVHGLGGWMYRLGWRASWA